MINSRPVARPKAVEKSHHVKDFAQSLDKKFDVTVKYEFGGPIGTAILMMMFPLLMFYLWACIECNNGQFGLGFRETVKCVMEGAYPTWTAAYIYLGFNALQFILAATIPGPIVKGLPLPSLDGVQLQYRCNGISCWYITLVLAVFSHVSGIFPLSSIIDNFGPIMTVAIGFGISVAILAYLFGLLTGNVHRMSGYWTYDLFMGAMLNPRILNVDLKMWSEIRIPWTILFFISLSATIKHYEMFGYVSGELAFMLLAHTLYVNACMKGEECIPTTWDIFYEKWGFMLIFWNLAGVPFSYCYSTLYLLNRAMKGNPIEHDAMYTFGCFVLLLVGYYIWDTANSQKNRYRMMQRGTYIKRSTFPQLPWGTLHNPKVITLPNGATILVDGWFAIARKIHYTADLMMALSWGLITGFSSPLTYFYFFFFITVLIHRVSRDMEKCAAKYGEYWKKYCEQVPYIFIPGIY